MKKLIILCMIAMALPVLTFAQKPKEVRELFRSWNNYEVSVEQVGTSGTKFLKVWGYGKKVDRAIVQAKKNAIHACLFRGIPGGNGANPTPAIIKDPSILENDAAVNYFYNFFETAGDYIQFVNLTTDGMPSGQDRREVKGGYKVAIYVQVMYDNLRKKMEADGYAKSISSGF